MKFAKSIVHIAAALFCTFGFAAVSFAGSGLSVPHGLAVDAAGNLWVANTGDNNILKFNSNYVLQPQATITAGIALPTGVAFDPSGNLWVANFAASNGGAYGSISMYTNGKQNTSATITNAIVAPYALAIDGIGNIWVSNDGTNVTVYTIPSPKALPSNLVGPLGILSGYTVYGITVSSQAVVWGSDTSGTVFSPPQVSLQQDQLPGFVVGGNNTGNALAAAANGDVYIGNLDGSVGLFSPVNLVTSVFTQLDFTPEGIAVDNAHGRIYFSDDVDSTIAVYSTSGALLHVIQ
jgi:streptogramin lyase